MSDRTKLRILWSKKVSASMEDHIKYGPSARTTSIGGLTINRYAMQQSAIVNHYCGLKSDMAWLRENFQ